MRILPYAMIAIIILSIIAYIYIKNSEYKVIVSPSLNVVFPLEYGKPPIIDVLMGNSTFRFLIDTGASDSLISSDVLAKVGVQKSYGFYLVTTATRYLTFMRKVSLIENIKIGGFVIDNVKWMLLPKSDTERFSIIFDGIIGRDILSNLILHLDYPNGIGSLTGGDVDTGEDTSLTQYKSVPMSKKATVKVDIGNRNKKFLIDSGGAFTMFLCKDLPGLEWSSTSVLKEVAIGKKSKVDYKVGIIPSIKLGFTYLSDIAVLTKLDPFKPYYGMIGHYFLEEGKFIIDFLHNKLLYRIKDEYVLSRESGSAIELEFVLTNIDSLNNASGFLRVLSIFPKNQLALECDLKKNDMVIKIDGEELIINSLHPNAVDVSDYAYRIILQRFSSLEVLRGKSLITLYKYEKGDKGGSK